MHRNAQYEARLQYRGTGIVNTNGATRFSVAVSIFVMTVAASAALAQTSSALVPGTSDGTALNVTIPVFDANIPEDPSVYRDHQVFPRIRNIEAKLMPFLLRETLVQTEQWGAVRVAKDPEPAAELQLFGTIVRSDGDLLELNIRAIDAAGYTWFDKVFSGHAHDNSEDQNDDQDVPAFRAVYDEIATELLAVRERIGDKAVSNIKGVSLMSYASELAPSAFVGYVGENDDGTLQLLRLPAREDAMLQRIEMIRSTEYVITDTVDAKFREFSADLTRTYKVWRQYRRKFVEYEEGNAAFAESRAGVYAPGSWDAIKHQYDAYKYHRNTVQEQDRLAVAFNTEVGATVESMEDRVEELEGWVEHGYVEWRGLLEELYEVERQGREQGE